MRGVVPVGFMVIAGGLAFYAALSGSQGAAIGAFIAGVGSMFVLLVTLP